MTRRYVDIYNLLLESIKTADSEVVLISAFVTSDIIKKIFLNLSGDVKVTVIARFKKQDVLLGSSDLQSAKIVLENGGRILRNSNLHAKLFMFDKETLIYGSANLTSRGLGLAKYSNIECVSTLDTANPADIFFVNSLIESSQIVDDLLINELEKQLKQKAIEEFDEDNIKKVSKKLNGIFINDFPFCESPLNLFEKESEPASLHDIHLLNFNLDKIELEDIKNNFINTKIMKWINVNIKTQVHFGELSAKIHNALIDDPKPYRKKVKDLQQNLLNWIRILIPNEFDIFIPVGRHSQVIKKRSSKS